MTLGLFRASAFLACPGYKREDFQLVQPDSELTFVIVCIAKFCLFRHSARPTFFFVFFYRDPELRSGCPSLLRVSRVKIRNPKVVHPHHHDADVGPRDTNDPDVHAGAEKKSASPAGSDDTATEREKFRLCCARTAL